MKKILLRWIQRDLELDLKEDYVNSQKRLANPGVSTESAVRIIGKYYIGSGFFVISFSERKTSGGRLPIQSSQKTVMPDLLCA
jgi:hypothetical protein